MLGEFLHSGVQISEHDPHVPLEQLYRTSAMSLDKISYSGSNFASKDRKHNDYQPSAEKLLHLQLQRCQVH